MQIQSLEEYDTLNEVKKVSKRFIEADPVILSINLATQLNELIMHYNGVEELRTSKQFLSFVLKTTRLQQVQLRHLNSMERTVLFLNIYNCLMVHAKIIFGIPTNQTTKEELLNKNYLITRDQYTLWMIYEMVAGESDKLQHLDRDLPELEHNVLLYLCLVDPFDAIVPFRVYTIENFDEQVEQRTREKLQSSMIFNLDKTEVSSSFIDDNL